MNPSAPARGELPAWLVYVGTVVIVFHFAAVGVAALSSPSGPWPGEESLVGPPLLVQHIERSLHNGYLRPLHLAHNYHMLANRMPATPGVYLEFQLLDDAGKEVASVRLPDEHVNPWIRHRQGLLVQAFNDDRRLTPPQSEILAAPGRQIPRVQYWDMADNRLVLRNVTINQIPRDHPVSGPSDVMFLAARAYSRHLCRAQGAAKARVLRHHQDPIRPFVLTMDNVSARAFEPVVSEFGEYPR